MDETEIEMGDKRNKGQKVMIRDLCFKSVPIRDYPSQVNSAGGKKVRKVKNFIKALPWLMKKLTPRPSNYVLTKPEAQMIKQLGTAFCNRARSDQDKIRQWWPGFNIEYFIDWADKMFGLIAVVVEGDPFYCTQWRKFYTLIVDTHENTKKIHGEDYMEQMKKIWASETAIHKAGHMLKRHLAGKEHDESCKECKRLLEDQETARQAYMTEASKLLRKD